MNEPKFPSEIGVIALVRLLSLRRGPLNLSYLCASPSFPLHRRYNH